MQRGIITINNNVFDEPYIAHPVSYDWGLAKVGSAKIFILVDNRDVSLDSHIYGALSIDNVTGKACFCY